MAQDQSNNTGNKEENTGLNLSGQELSQRSDKGFTSGLVSLAVNFSLFLFKLLLSFHSASLAILGDALNNLSDFVSSLITLASFKFSKRPADRDHPFGHARLEYISSSAVAIFILLIAFELGRSSFSKIFHPSEISFSYRIVATYLVSMISKTCLYFYQKKLAAEVNSVLIKAAAIDSLSDVMISLGLLVALSLGAAFHIKLDGYASLILAIFIGYSGVQVLLETSNQLLGTKAPKLLRRQIRDYVESFDHVLGTHDLVVHSYGPGSCFATIHVEVAAERDLMANHLLIDKIEREALLDLSVNLVIHMDPIWANDPQSEEYYQLVCQLAAEIAPRLYVHDFRTNRLTGDQDKGSESEETIDLVFDLAVPDEVQLQNEEIRTRLQKLVQSADPNLNCFITIDRNYEIDPVPVDVDYK